MSVPNTIAFFPQNPSSSWIIFLWNLHTTALPMKQIDPVIVPAPNNFTLIIVHHYILAYHFPINVSSANSKFDHPTAYQYPLLSHGWVTVRHLHLVANLCVCHPHPKNFQLQHSYSYIMPITISRDKSSSILYRLFQSLCISETLSMISTFQRFHNCVGQYHKCRLNWKTNRADGSPILVCINIIRFFPTQPRMPPRLRDHIANNHSYPPSSSSSSPSAAATILIIAFIVDYLSVQWPALTFSLRHVKSTIFHTFITSRSRGWYIEHSNERIASLQILPYGTNAEEKHHHRQQ